MENSLVASLRRVARCAIGRWISGGSLLLSLLLAATPAWAQYVNFYSSNEAAYGACMTMARQFSYGAVSCPVDHLNANYTCYDMLLPGTDRSELTCGARGQCFCGPYTPPACKVGPLTPVTDPVAKDHEDGRYQSQPDLDNVLPATAAGGACMQQRVASGGAQAVITSGFRPQSYQDHLREVWDKWQLLKNDASPDCAQVRADVQKEFSRHALVRRPVENSRHTSGRALDIAGVPAASADTLAGQCNMFRPEPVNDSSL